VLALGERGGQLWQPSVHRVFMQLSRKIGLRHSGDRTGPRIHDFRHRFAIRTLVDWYREGTDVEKKLPALSTYLGHTCAREQYCYFSASPDLLQVAARRLDRRGRPNHEAELQCRRAH
jgi:integrase/recombinase XerD